MIEMSSPHCKQVNETSMDPTVLKHLLLSKNAVIMLLEQNHVKSWTWEREKKIRGKDGKGSISSQ